jgi:MoxR-like ATPase
MALEDNINKEHVKIILKEYESSKDIAGLEKAITHIGYPQKYSTFLLQALLSEWAFTGNYKEKEFKKLRNSKRPKFEEILSLAIGDFYTTNNDLFCYKDKATHEYQTVLSPQKLNMIETKYYIDKREQFEKDEIDLPAFLYDMNKYMSNRSDNFKTEFSRALNIAESWSKYNVGIAAYFLDYAMLRLTLNNSLGYIPMVDNKNFENSVFRKKLIKLMNDAKIKIDTNKPVLPTEKFDSGFTMEPTIEKYPEECDPECGNKEEKEPKIEVETDTERKNKVLSLDDHLNTVIFEQNHAIKEVSTVLLNKESGIGHPDRAYGLIFFGPSGVGKTELARQLNDYFYPGQEMLKVDCTEYSEEHYIARLIGSPPGYVGSQENGLVADFVRKYGHGVILFDEVEKAHEKVRNFLLTLLDTKTMTDNHKKPYDVSDMIVIMTSNAGNVGPDATKRGIGFGNDQDAYSQTLRSERIKEDFPPAFLGRCHIVHFNQLSYDGIIKIFNKKLKLIQDNVYKQSSINVAVSDTARDELLRQCNWTEHGARNVERNLEKILTPFSVEIVKQEKLKSGDTALLDYDKGFKYILKSKDGQCSISLK